MSLYLVLSPSLASNVLMQKHISAQKPQVVKTHNINKSELVVSEDLMIRNVPYTRKYVDPIIFTIL